MLSALIFDVDGTLADTESLHLEAFNHAFEQGRMDWHWDLAHYTRLLEISGGKERMLHHWRQVNPGLQELGAGAVQATIEQLHDTKTAYYENAVNNGAVALRAGVLDLMQEARAQGLQLAIATTTSPVNIAALLRSAMGSHWRSHFMAVGDASNAPLKKPHPQVYQKVLGDLGLPGSCCIAFEDSSNGLRASAAAGLATIVTPNGFTAHHDFTGALRVLPDLSHVSVAKLREWHAALGRSQA
jgi:HAD superfamily hydrolase (TIGR01509 family)